MINLIDNPKTARHILWHWILGVTMVFDGMIAVLTLGFFHSWLCTIWMESRLGDRLHEHPSIMPTQDEALLVMAQAMGVPIENITLAEASPFISKPPSPKQWN